MKETALILMLNGEPELAKMRLEAALKVQERIQHPGTPETIKLLAELSGNR